MKSIIALTALLAVAACSSTSSDSGTTYNTGAVAQPSAALATQPQAATAPAQPVAATTGGSTTANATAAKPEPTDKQLEKLTTTAKRPVYCSDAAPTGSLIRRGVVCDPPPRTSAERTAQKLMNKQTVDDSVELSDKLMRERMDCEAMRGHENGGTKIPGCI